MILATLILAVGGVTIELPEQVACSGVSLTLGDVAEVSGEDKALVERVSAMDLGYMPAPGYSRLLYRERLHATALRLFPEQELSFQGAEKTRVAPKTQVVAHQQVKDAARAILLEKFEGQDVEIDMRGKLVDLLVPLGKSSIEVTARKASGPVGHGSHGVAVDVMIDGELWRTQWTSWTVQSWQQVPVLIVPVQRGQKLSTAMFKMERRKTAQAATSPLQPSQVLEAQAKRNLLAGQPVLATDVERRLFVKKGNLVQVEVVAGVTRATGTGVALQDGHLGDTVRIRMENSGKEILGGVSGSNHIQVLLR